MCRYGESTKQKKKKKVTEIKQYNVLNGFCDKSYLIIRRNRMLRYGYFHSSSTIDGRGRARPTRLFIWGVGRYLA